MALVDRGKLRLDDPIPLHLPEFERAAELGWPTLPLFIEGPKAKERPAARPPTVRDLLMHTAGVLPLEFERVVGGVVQAAGYADATPSERLRRVSAELARLPLLHDPGDDFLYAVQFDLLGRLLERAGGQPLDELLRRLVFEPCGMDSTFFSVPPARRADMRRCYAANPRTGLGAPGEFGPPIVDVSQQIGDFKVWRPDGLGYFSGSEGLVSSAADFHAFAARGAGGRAGREGGRASLAGRQAGRRRERGEGARRGGRRGGHSPARLSARPSARDRSTACVCASAAATQPAPPLPRSRATGTRSRSTQHVINAFLPPARPAPTRRPRRPLCSTAASPRTPVGVCSPPRRWR